MMGIMMGKSYILMEAIDYKDCSSPPAGTTIPTNAF